MSVGWVLLRWQLTWVVPLALLTSSKRLAAPARLGQMQVSRVAQVVVAGHQVWVVQEVLAVAR
ncbi:MAG: hypothetical protein MUF54_24505 [Polyangiaceae bacterium]|jgi:hypothetical protein|nr:hypothetical protein [Polyangiaceae bacterium]